MPRAIIDRVLYDTDRATPVCEVRYNPNDRQYDGFLEIIARGPIAFPAPPYFDHLCKGKIDWWLFVGQSGKAFCADMMTADCIVPVSRGRARRMLKASQSSRTCTGAAVYQSIA